MLGGNPKVPSAVIEPRPDAPPRPLDPATMAARDAQLAKDKQRQGLGAQFRSGYGLKTGKPTPQGAVKTLLGQ